MFTDTHDDEGSIPDEKIATSSSCNSNLRAWQEDSFGVKATFSVRRCKILFVSWRRVVVELCETWLPVQEEHSLVTITAKLVWIVRVELDPVLILEDVSVLEL